jgi:hypothetical protein
VSIFIEKIDYLVIIVIIAMPSHATSTLADMLKLLFVGLVIFYVVYIIKIPVICAGCDPLVGVWYRCMAGTGVGTPTCDIDQSGSYVFSWSILSDLNKILADSGLTTLPKQWLQAIINLWVTIKGLAQTVVDQTVSLYNVVKTEFTKIINEYIIGYPVAGWEGFKSNVIIPIITGVTNYVINPVKNLIQQVVDFKNTALEVLKSTVSTVKGVGDTIYEYTYGFLVDGFDQIPHGLVLFVQGIQNLLNMLKHGIITFANGGLNLGIDAVNFITQTAMQAAKGAMSGTQYAVDGISSGLNWATAGLINNAVNPVVGGLNSALYYDFGNPITTGVNVLASGVQTGVNSVLGVVQTGVNGIISGTQAAVNGTLGVVQTGVNGIITGTQYVVDGVVNGTEYIVNNIFDGVNWVVGKLNWLYNDIVIDSVVNPIIGLINSTAIYAANKIAGGVNVAIDYLNGLINNINNVRNNGWSIGGDWFGWSILGYDIGFNIPVWSFYPFRWLPEMGNVGHVGGADAINPLPRGAAIGTVNKLHLNGVDLGDVNLGRVNLGGVNLGSVTIPGVNISGLRISQYPETVPRVASNALEVKVPRFSDTANATISGWQVSTRLNKDVITEPTDLFWAGSRQIRYGDAKYPSGSVCANIANSYLPGTDINTTYANAPNTAIYDQFNTSTCMFSSMVSVTNNYIGQQSCSDVCYAYGQQAYDSLDVVTAGCTNTFSIYGTPEQNAIQTMTTPSGLPIYIYKNQPCYYFAPKMYKLNMTLDFNSFTTVDNKRNYAVTENVKIILEVEKQYFVPVENGGYRDTRDNKYYVLGSPLNTIGGVKAWQYFIDTLTDTPSTCDKEYLLPSTPEALGMKSTYTTANIKVYMIDDKPYVFMNPKLLRLTPTMTPVTLDQLNNATTAYSYTTPYIDGKPDQIATKYTQKGYVLNIVNSIPLPTQIVNNTKVTYSPQQAGYTFNTSAALGIQYYTHPSYSGKYFYYDKTNGKMVEVNLSNSVVNIIGTPQSNGYTASTIVGGGFTNSSGTYIFGVVDQTQYYIVMKQVGYEILPQLKVGLKYTISGGNIIYNTPAQDGFLAQAADSYGLIRYLKNGIYYVFDSNANVMVPLNEATPSQTIYGGPDLSPNTYTKQLTGYKKNDLTYFFVVNQRYLCEYYSKSLYNPTCSCYTAKVVSKTCKDFCAAKKDDTGASFGCDNSATTSLAGAGCNDSRVTDFNKCVCTEQGPVNVIVKPMQEYNPFRLLKNAVNSGVDQLTSVIKYAIQSFLTPIWNTIKYIIQFMASLVWSAIQFIYLWFTSDSGENPIMAVIKDFLGSLKDGFNEYVVQRFIKDIIIDGIKSIIPTKEMLMSLVTPVVEFFKTSFRVMLDAFKTAFDAVTNALKYFFLDILPKVLFYILTSLMIVIDKATFFLPISKTTKLFIICVMAILGVLFYFTGQSWEYIVKGVDALLYTVFFVITSAYNMIVGGK